MKLKFCGAARNVTGSCHLLILDDGTKILLDCGLYQGDNDDWDRNNKWYFDPKEIDYLILSHAHIDHTGRVPKLVKDGFKGRIICTHATLSLASLMLLDSAFIQETDVEHWNKRQLRKNPKFKDFREPLYTVEDAQEAMTNFISISYDKWYPVTHKVSLLFKDAGHILGSASVTLKIVENGEERLIGFTGDIGRPNRPILRDPAPMPEVEHLICESTYGDKLHESPPEQLDKFLEVIQHTCIKNRGKLIVPAFSVGRTQELVYMLDQLENAGKLPRIKIYVDSPLAVDATEVFRSHPECFDKEMHKYMMKDSNPFGFKNLIFVKSVNESKNLNSSKEPCIIISASGMGNAGRIKHHIFNNVGNPQNTILIVGYCTPDTPGGRLRDGHKTLRLFGEEVMVKASVVLMDSFSAHGDQQEMTDFISNHRLGLQKLYLVHGDIDTQEAFKKHLNKNGFNKVEIPHEGQEYDI
jgi:metallo-beta-lactamase family protein